MPIAAPAQEPVEVENDQLVAVASRTQASAEAYAREWKTSRAHGSYEALLADREIDVIYNPLPNHLHAEWTIKAVEAGKHVLCEKPMCLAMEAAWSMMDTAHFFRRKLFIVKQNRFNAPVQFVKNILDEGKLGKILSFQLNCFWHRPQEYYDGGWRGTKALDGGLLYTQFSHFIDLLYWFVGEVDKVQGYKKNNCLRTHLQFEDTGVANLKMIFPPVRNLPE